MASWWRLPCLVAFACGLTVLGAALWRHADERSQGAERVSRNFYGVLRVVRYDELTEEQEHLTLLHGRISHGSQYVAEHKRLDATTYYGPQSGIGLALTHLPDTGDDIAARGGRLILAGHTHGGQIRVPIITRAALRISGSRYVAGWYRTRGGRLYVSAGVGSSVVRWRVGRQAQPEVTLLDLIPA